jgi:hypothetical protein
MLDKRNSKLRKKPQRKIAVIDLETDPFKFGRLPKPFAAGFYDGETYIDFWGPSCVKDLMAYLSGYEEPLLIYAHNGGKFDYFYLFDYLENPVRIINGRITEAAFEHHVLRDSYSIIPRPLRDYAKDEIDYAIFEEHRRNVPKNRADILHYLAKDCEYLHELVSAFVTRFGPKLTIGSTAISELRKLHPFYRTDETHDTKFRPFYFGGRVQAFRTGEIKGAWNIYDVNSMYPHVMRNRLHPTGSRYATPNSPRLSPSGKLIGFGDRPFFIEVTGTNRGALPMRTKEGLDFTIPRGRFLTMSHELQVALKHGLFTVEKVHAAFVPHQTISFEAYVDTHVADKIACKKAGDKGGELFAKLLLNSAYGKFGQNPDNYYDYMIVRDVSVIPREEWELWDLYEQHNEFGIWRKKSGKKLYFDVATAASITSASRAMLLDAIATSDTPIYCDTDSIICKTFSGHIHDSELGAWKNEGSADMVAIAGKKLYAAFLKGDCIKSATKGVRLDAADILKLCRGQNVKWKNDAPSFSIAHGEVKFIERVLTSRK